MRTLLRPVAFGVVLLLGAGPAAALACELACASPSGQAHHDAASHQHSPAVDDRASSPDAVPSLRARASECEHDVVGSPVLTSSALTVSGPIGRDLIESTVPDLGDTHLAPTASVRAGPPGIRSGPLPLRI